MTPPMASEPYSALCGPRSTSTRSIVPGAISAKLKSPAAPLGSLTRMPSISTSVWPVLAPRSITPVVPAGPPACVTVSPGTERSASVREAGLLVASVSPLMTLMALPV